MDRWIDREIEYRNLFHEHAVLLYIVSTVTRNLLFTLKYIRGIFLSHQENKFAVNLSSIQNKCQGFIPGTVLVGNIQERTQQASFLGMRILSCAL